MDRKLSKKVSKKRADLLLVERGLAESREKAQVLIMEGLVRSPTEKVLKPGTLIASDAPLEVTGRLPYVGRGGIKLAHALDYFGLDVSGKVALDVGASTGGFTDCLLQRGARRVIALDVGHGQLDYRLRQDPRVTVIEGVNARYPFSLPQGPYSTHQQVPSPSMGESPSPLMGEGRDGGDSLPPTSVLPHKGGRRLSSCLPPVESELKVDLATVDVSFISTTRVIPSVAQHVKDGGAIIVLVKPQYEARRAEVGRGGVIKDPQVHARVLARVILWVVGAQHIVPLRLRNLTPSPILGDAGNREFFLLLKK